MRALVGLLLVLLVGCVPGVAPVGERDPFVGSNSRAVLDGDPIGTRPADELRRPLALEVVDPEGLFPLELGQLWLLRRRAGPTLPETQLAFRVRNAGDRTLCDAIPWPVAVLDDEGQPFWDDGTIECDPWQDSVVHRIGSIGVVESVLGGDRPGTLEHCLAPGEQTWFWSDLHVPWAEAATVRMELDLDLSPEPVMEPHARVLPVSYTVDPDARAGGIELVVENQGQGTAWYDGDALQNAWTLVLLDDQDEPLAVQRQLPTTIGALDPGERATVALDGPFSDARSTRILFAGTFSDAPP